MHVIRAKSNLMKHLKNKYSVLFCTLMTFALFISCNKEVVSTEDINNAPSDVVVTVDINDFSATISWTNATDQDDDQLSYDVYLQNSSIAEGLSTTSHTVNNLEVNFSYSGRIVVSDGNGGSSETTFTFETGTAAKTIGGSGNDFGRIILEVEEGNYMIASNSRSSDGFVDTNFGFSDIVISKHDPYGNLLWSSVLGSSLSDSALDMIKTNDNQYLIVGRSGRIFKIDGDGNTVWQTILREDPNNSDSREFGLNSAVQLDDGFIFAGSITSSTNINQIGVLVKTDLSGNYLWDKRYGGTGTDIFRDMILLNDGNLMVTGETGSDDGDFPNSLGEDDIIMAKFDTNGDLIFFKRAGGTDFDRARKIIESNGRIYIAGESWSNDIDFSNNNGLIDSFVGEIDTDGNVIWLKNYGTPTFNSFRTFFVKGTDIYLSLDDATLENGWVLKIDGTGNQTDEIILGGSGDDSVTYMTNYANGTMALIGHSDSTDLEGQTNLGGYDILFYKF